MPEKNQPLTFPPYPKWYVKITVVTRPGLSVSLDKEGWGFTDFQAEMLAFVANASDNFSFVSPEYYECPSPEKNSSPTPT